MHCVVEDLVLVRWHSYLIVNIRDNFAKPHTLSLAYKASTFFDHGDLYMNFFKYKKNNK